MAIRKDENRALEALQALLTRPESLLANQMQLTNAWMSATARALTPPPSEKKQLFDAIKQGYLLAAKAVFDAIERAPDVAAETKSRIAAFTKQFCDAMSPTNMAFLNPNVIEETVRTGGANLHVSAQKALQELRENRGGPPLVDEKACEVGKNVATTKGDIVYRNGVMELLQYAPTTPTVHRRPLVVVPPWIDKYYVMDLQPSNSFVKYALDNGFQTFLVSWIDPGESQSYLGFEDYLDTGALTAARVATKIAGTSDANFMGFCLGGTLVAMMLAYLERTGEPLAHAATLFTTLVDFSEPGDLKNFLNPQALAFMQQQLEEKGVGAGPEMAGAFNLLRANDLLWNVAVNRYLVGQDAPAFGPLHRSRDSTRLSADFHSCYVRNMYVGNDLVKPDALAMHDVPLDLSRVKNDVYAVAAKDDRIAPWSSCYKTTQVFSGDVQFRLGHGGHIAGIVNPPGAGKGNYWKAPWNPPQADDWFGIAQKISGSFWPEWAAWLAARSGEKVRAPQRAGSTKHPTLGAAPRTRVLTKA